MERLVEGAREPSSFLQWQKEMREKDLQEELASIERRRLEGRISYEEAAMARTRIMARNQRAAQLKKEEVGISNWFKDDLQITPCFKVCNETPFKDVLLKGFVIKHQKCV